MVRLEFKAHLDTFLCNRVLLSFQNKTQNKFPILLYIHGGSNEVGMGAMFDGDVLAGFGQIIVITFNYRLGALGKYIRNRLDISFLLASSVI